MKKWMLFGVLGLALAIPFAFWVPGFLMAELRETILAPSAALRSHRLYPYPLPGGTQLQAPLFERGLGQDKLMGMHRFAGLFGFSFMAAHPVFDFTSDLIHVGHVLLKWQMIFGLIALILAVLTVGSAILFHRLRLKYGKWKDLHWVNYIILPVVFIHSMLLGSDIAAQPALRYYWLFLWGVFTLLIGAIFITGCGSAIILSRSLRLCRKVTIHGACISRATRWITNRVSSLSCPCCVKEKSQKCIPSLWHPAPPVETWLSPSKPSVISPPP